MLLQLCCSICSTSSAARSKARPEPRHGHWNVGGGKGGKRRREVHLFCSAGRSWLLPLNYASLCGALNVTYIHANSGVPKEERQKIFAQHLCVSQYVFVLMRYWLSGYQQKITPDAITSPRSSANSNSTPALNYNLQTEKTNPA